MKDEAQIGDWLTEFFPDIQPDVSNLLEAFPEIFVPIIVNVQEQLGVTNDLSSHLPISKSSMFSRFVRSGYLLSIRLDECFVVEKHFSSAVRKQIPLLASKWFERVIPSALVLMNTGYVVRNVDPDNVCVEMIAYPKAALAPAISRFKLAGRTCKGIIVRDGDGKLLPLAWNPDGRPLVKLLTKRLAVTVLLMTALLVSTTVWTGHRLTKQIDAEVVQLEAEIESRSSHNKELAETFKKMTAQAAVQNILSIRLERSGDFSRIYENLARVSPENTWLKSLSFDIEDGLEIEGLSLDAEDFVLRLQGSGLFKSTLPLSPFVNSDRTGATSFKLALSLR